MMELYHELFPVYGSCASVVLGGVWLAYRARRRAAERERAMRESTFMRTPYFLLQRVR